VSRTTLTGIHEPTQVSIHGRVASPNDVTSLLSGMHAALFTYRFFVRWSNENRDLLDDSDLFGRS